MSWRSVLEDAYTVKCKGCGVEFVDPGKWLSQKWLRGRCPLWGHEQHKKRTITLCRPATILPTTSNTAPRNWALG